MPESLQTIVNEPFKATILGYKSEIETMKRLLEGQTEENAKLRQNIIMLEYELDLTKELVDRKQKEIVKISNAILEKDIIVADLEKELATAKVERSAYQRLEDTNNALIKRNEDLRKEKEQIELMLGKSLDEIQYLKSLKDNARLEELLTKDIKSKNEISSLTTNNNILLKDRERLLRLVESLRLDIKRLQEMQIQQAEEFKSSMSKVNIQSFEALSKTMKLEDALNKTQDEFSETQENMQKVNVHREMLQDQLAETLEDYTETTQVLKISTAQTDARLNIARKREKDLLKEIMKLEACVELHKKRERYCVEELKFHLNRSQMGMFSPSPQSSPVRPSTNNSCLGSFNDNPSRPLTEFKQSEGKTILLHRYLKDEVERVNKLHTAEGRGYDIDLSNCELADSDLKEVCCSN